ncbi:MAG: NADH-quinone oxidoreductase subunit NuoH [Kouleothrix sp.]|jgi:NADH-quinone oxidoreductase subunit H|nr:NADH-quinone oxidoreductase subunit NuoH [Kouleothrix sp.]
MIDVLQSLLGSLLPSWLIYVISFLVNTTIILIVTPVTFMMMTWFERRIVARMQDRLGPNRVGPAGLLQAVADGVKMFTKENITPRAADKWVHLIAPIVATAPVMFLFAVIPWGRGLEPSATDVSVLFVVAISSISAVGLMMGGWGSNNKFALLGAMRAVAQMVSYEIPAVIALLSMVLFTSTMNLNSYSALQGGIPLLGSTLADAGVPDLGLGWFVFTPIGLLGFAIFFICVLSEGERTPFDIPEADSEIVAGYMTEYSGMKFAVFYMGQFLFNYAFSMVAAIVFLGGWNGPGVGLLVQAGVPFLAGLLSIVYLLIKAWFLFFVMIWLRGAFPRLRMDQLMGFAWKFLLPLALINILSAALWLTVMLWGSDPKWTVTIAPFGLNLLGWLEPAPVWARQLLGLAITGVINTGAFFWLLQVNRRVGGETPAELAQDQAFGVASLP